MTLNKPTTSEAVVRNCVMRQMQVTSEASQYCKALLDSVSALHRSWAIVGGAPRNWVTELPEEPRDLDVVISINPPLLEDIIAEWCSKFDADAQVQVKRTSLGGYRLETPKITIDTWAAPTTVSIANGRLNDRSNTYRAVAKSAALSLDSLVVTSNGAIYEHGFFETLRTGILKLNYSDVEQPSSMAQKAVRLCETYGLIPDLSLQSLISSMAGRQLSLRL